MSAQAIKDFLSHNDIDSEKYYTGFSSSFQDYTFDKEDNQFIIESGDNGSNKHGKEYKIIISL